jgi:hypothetical protein
MTMQMEHVAGNIHLTERMQDGARHPYRVAMMDGGAAIVMPEDSTWMQSVVFHGMPTDMLNDPEIMSRMLRACWAMAECCRDSMGDMRRLSSTGGGGTSTGASGGGSSGSPEAMTGQMATIVCGNCTINLTM